MNNKWIVFTAISLFIASGCVQETKKGGEIVEPDGSASNDVPIEVIDRKIVYLKELLNRENLSDGDREIAAGLMKTYRSLRENQTKDGTVYDRDEIIETLFSSLSILDEKYFSKETSVESGVRAMNDYSLRRRGIMGKYLEGDYQGVINDCMTLEARFGPNALTPDIGLLFSLSLAKKGLIQEAANIGNRILGELEGKPDIMHLRSSILEWQIELGHGERASGVYEKLMGDLDEREALIESAKIRLDHQDEALGPQEQQTTARSPLRSMAGDSESLGQLFKEVDLLVHEQEFQKAKILLIKYRLAMDESPEMDIIDQALKNVGLREEDFYREKNIKATMRDEILKLTVSLMEEENYQEAILRLEHLEEDGGGTPETNELKGLAIEKLINQERNRAAVLFLKAKRSQDPEKKAELLNASYGILKAIVDKYPLSPLNDKINDHINSIREELGKVEKNPV